MPGRDKEQPQSQRLTGWGWFAILAMAAILGAAIWYCVNAWNAMAGVGISRAGWLFLGLGVVVTIVVGGGLMALVFYSSRKGKDF